MKKLLLLLAVAGGFAFDVFAQNPDSPVFPDATATDKTLFVANNAATTLTAAITTTSQTAIQVGSTANFIMPTVVRIRSESIAICSKTLTVLTACTVAVDGFDGRGFSQTTATTHPTSASVVAVIDRAFHNRLAAEVKALEANAVVQGPGTKTTDAITVYDANGKLIASDCRVNSGLECGSGESSAGLELPELAANGANSFALYGKDNQAASVCLILPDAAPTSGQVLKDSGTHAQTTDGKICDVMEWGSAASDRVSAPQGATSACSIGQWAADVGYFYYCAAADTWVRSALSTWATVATPTFNPPSPYVGAATNVTISTTTPSATLKYCIDAGNTCDPSAGTTYTTPVNMASTGYLRAIGSKTGYDNSAIASWSGTIGGVSDAFTGTGALSAPWSARVWTVDATHEDCHRVSDVVKITGDYYKCTALNTTASLGSDGWVQADFQFQANTGLGPIWRAAQTGMGQFYFLTFDTNTVVLRQVLDGVNSYVDEAHPTFAFTANAWYTVKVEYTGGAFQVSLGVQGAGLTNVATFNSTALTGGKPGVIAMGGEAPYPGVDNFQAQ